MQRDVIIQDLSGKRSDPGSALRETSAGPVPRHATNISLNISVSGVCRELLNPAVQLGHCKLERPLGKIQVRARGVRLEQSKRFAFELRGVNYILHSCSRRRFRFCSRLTLSLVDSVKVIRVVHLHLDRSEFRSRTMLQLKHLFISLFCFIFVRAMLCLKSNPVPPAITPNHGPMNRLL